MALPFPSVEDPRTQAALTALSNGWPIVGAYIKEATIEKVHIVEKTLTGSLFVEGTITGNLIAGETITAANIAAGTIEATQIKAATITGEKIAAGTITATNIKAGSITTGSLEAESVTTTILHAEAVTAAKIKALNVEATHIKASAITTEKLNASAVTTEKLAANSVTSEKIVAGTIEASDIKAHTITANEIEAAGITSGALASGAVTAGKIASGGVQAGNIAAAAIDGMTITGAILRTAASGNRVIMDIEGIRAYKGETAVLNFDTATGNLAIKGKLTEGSEVPAGSITGTIGESQIGSEAVTTGKIKNGTILAADIASETITATQIAGTTITGAKIAAETITANKLTVSTLSAITADLGSITAGTITGATFRTSAELETVLDGEGLTFKATTGPSANREIEAVRSDDGSSLATLGWSRDTTKKRNRTIMTTYAPDHLTTIDFRMEANTVASERRVIFAAGSSGEKLITDGESKSSFLQLSSERKERDFGIVEALPGSPVKGDRCKYKAATGVYWDLVYTEEATYPWAKVGGPPLSASLSTQATLNNKTTYTSLTSPLEITMPLKGEYDVEVQAGIAVPATAGATGGYSFEFAGTEASDNDGIFFTTPSGTAESGNSTGLKGRKTATEASKKVVEKARTLGAYQCGFARRRLWVDPVRVG